MSNVISINRPGIALGSYPERSNNNICKWDKFISNLSSRLIRSNLSRRGKEFVNDVKKHQLCLVELSNNEITIQIRNLRKELFTKGQSTEFLIKSFALVREVSSRTMGMEHFDNQIFGGWVISQGKLAEMQTGEGKTLTATLPACSAALSGIPVHIITSNDYLVVRDAEWMGPIYKRLGLTVGTVTEGSTEEQRREAYACDITYCTGKQIVFDYLRDRMLRVNVNTKLKHKLDGLRGERSISNRLVMRGLSFAIIDEADSILIDEAKTPFILSKSNPNQEQHDVCVKALNFSRTLKEHKDYVISLCTKEIELTSSGKKAITNLSDEFSGIWKGALLREELIRQALYARLLLKRGRDYLVSEGKIKIVDQNTGRVMPDRSWGQGLHQIVEVKENCKLTSTNVTISRITYQEFFRKYIMLSGMTGTAIEVKNELQSVYDLEVQIVPANKTNLREQLPTKVFKTIEEKWQAVVNEIIAMNKQQRPVLVGTYSVSDSEIISKILKNKGLKHQVLNAKQNKDEARIIAKAGQLKQITIATNMAGRGTDIKLNEQVEKIGGLHIIVTQRNDSSRVDRQLIGRCARQGDQGSYRFILSLQDELVENNFSLIFKKAISNRSYRFVNSIGNKVISVAQCRVEKMHATTRKNIMRIEPELKKTLAFASMLK